MVVRLQYDSDSVQLVHLYLKAKGEPHEIRTTLEWVAPFMNAPEFFTIGGGDLNANPGWDPHNPIASGLVTEAIQDFVRNTNIRVKNEHWKFQFFNQSM